MSPQEKKLYQIYHSNSSNNNCDYKKTNNKPKKEESVNPISKKDMMKSNIFNLEEKPANNLKPKKQVIEKKIETPKHPESVKNVKKSAISTVFDWKSSNTEIIFKTQNSNKENYSPTKMKFQNIKHHYRACKGLK